MLASRGRQLTVSLFLRPALVACYPLNEAFYWPQSVTSASAALSAIVTLQPGVDGTPACPARHAAGHPACAAGPADFPIPSLLKQSGGAFVRGPGFLPIHSAAALPPGAHLPAHRPLARGFATDKIPEVEVGVPKEEREQASLASKPSAEELNPAHQLKASL